MLTFEILGVVGLVMTLIASLLIKLGYYDPESGSSYPLMLTLGLGVGFLVMGIISLITTL